MLRFGTLSIEDRDVAEMMRSLLKGEADCDTSSHVHIHVNLVDPERVVSVIN